MDIPDKNFLKNTTFFRLLPSKIQHSLIPKITTLQFQFGDVIIQEGEVADCLYILASGKARVLTIAQDGNEVPLSTLGPGDCFGEIGILTSGKRTKTIRASNNETTAYVLGKDDLGAILSENPKVKEYLSILIKHRNLENFLRQYTSLANISPEHLHSILNKFTPTTFCAGEKIIAEGEETGPMYIIEEGYCRVYCKKGAKKKTLAYLRQGEFFGELSLIQGVKRSATVEAISDCVLLSLDPEALQEILREHVSFRNILERRIDKYKINTEHRRLPLDVAQFIENQSHSSSLCDAEKIINHPEDILLLENDTGKLVSFLQRKLIGSSKRTSPRYFPHVHQIDESDCGAAALCMVLQYFGHHVELALVRNLSNTSLEGTTLRDLCKAAEKMGLHARPAKVSIRNVDSIHTPAILHWQNNHWVVLIQQKKDKMQIADPAKKISWVTSADFAKNWSGYAVLFDPPDKSSSLDNTVIPSSRNHFLKYLLTRLNSIRGTIFKVLIISLAICALQSLFPILTERIVDDIILLNQPSNLTWFVTCLGGGLAVTLLLTIFQKLAINNIAAHIDEFVLNFIIERLFYLPISYFRRRSPEDIQRRFEGAKEIQQFLIHDALGSVIASMQLITFLVLMTLCSVTMTLMFLVLAPIYLGLMFFSAKILRPAFINLQDNEIKLEQIQKDIIQGMDAIKAAGVEKSYKKIVLEKLLRLRNDRDHSTFNIYCYEGTIQVLSSLSIIFFLWIGTRLVLSEELTMGGFIAFHMLIAMSYSPILTVLNMWERLQLSSILLNRLNDLSISNREEQAQSSLVTTFQGKIEFRNVSIKEHVNDYTPEIKNISFTAHPGELFAIVGRNNAGKSSLAKSIAGLLESVEGEILYDGVHFQDLHSGSLRKFIGLVTENEYLFSGTIAQNIALGDPNPDMDKIIRTAKMVCIHDIIMSFPSEYQTTIRDISCFLPQVQKQAIAIARALYREPSILIFDEATSTMDLETEQILMANIRRLYPEQLIFLITHRLNTIINANEILVLDKGRIVEHGNHKELIERNGLYRQLYVR